MVFSYKPLWKLLIDRDLTKGDLIQQAHISRSTLNKLNRGDMVSMDIIGRICTYLQCDVGDIISFQEK